MLSSVIHENDNIRQNVRFYNINNGILNKTLNSVSGRILDRILDKILDSIIQMKEYYTNIRFHYANEKVSNKICKCNRIVLNI